MEPLVAGDLRLEPLTVAHADEMFDVLADPRIYRYLDDGPPPSREHLQAVYTRLEARFSPDGTQRWLNWIVRASSGAPLGVVQATLVAPRTAWVAYVLASRYWGQGHARSATRAMIDHLVARHGIAECLATVEDENARSIALLEALGFRPAKAVERAEHDLTATERLCVLACAPG